MNKVVGRTKYDCAVSVLCTLTGIWYEDACEMLGAEYVDGRRGMTSYEIMGLLVGMGRRYQYVVAADVLVAAGHLKSDLLISKSQILKLIIGRSCILTTVNESGKGHAVAWDGACVLDPALGEELRGSFYDYEVHEAIILD